MSQASTDKELSTAEAVVEIERGYRLFRAFEKGHQVAEYLKSVDQQVRTLEAKRDTAKDEAAKSEQTMQTAHAKVAQHCATCDSRTADATRAADASIAKAQSDAQSKIDTYHASIAEAKGREDGLIAQRKAALLKLETEIGTAESALAKLTGQVEAARAQVSRLLKA